MALKGSLVAWGWGDFQDFRKNSFKKQKQFKKLDF
jgi:hypothetical protein